MLDLFKTECDIKCNDSLLKDVIVLLAIVHSEFFSGELEKCILQ